MTRHHDRTKKNRNINCLRDEELMHVCQLSAHMYSVLPSQPHPHPDGKRGSEQRFPVSVYIKRSNTHTAGADRVHVFQSASHRIHILNVMMTVAWCLCEINALPCTATAKANTLVRALTFRSVRSVHSLRSLRGPGIKRCIKFKSLSYLQCTLHTLL